MNDIVKCPECDEVENIAVPYEGDEYFCNECQEKFKLKEKL